MRRTFVSAFVGLAVTLVLLGASCTNGDGLVVFAAASLDGHLPNLHDETVSFAGSNALVAQVIDGAPVGVLITANRQVAQPIIDDLDPPTIELVANTITIVVPKGNPGAVASLEDLADPDRTIAICAPEVPCGQATSALSIPISADSLEPNVRSVVTKVELGEVDAGLVYRTDVARSPDIEEVALLADASSVTYLALLLDPANAAAVEYFDWLGNQGRQDLVASGFETP